MQKLTLLILFLSFLSFEGKAQQTLSETLFQNGVQRQYTVYIPEIYDGTTPVPLMFNFHGFTGNANGHLGATRMKPIADTANFILVYPQGSLFFGNTHWNVGAWTNGSNANDLGFTEAMIDTLASTYNIDLDRVYSCGYSNGGYFSFELACQLSHRIAAIGSVGGKMSSETFNACNPVHPTPVITIHGTQDNTVTYEGSKPANSKSVAQGHAYWMNFNNTDNSPEIVNIPNTNTSDGSTVEYFEYGNGDNCSALAHYKVIGGGHDWPGAWGNKDIDASSVIWNFVSQYDINGLISCNITSPTAEVYADDEISLFPNPASNWVTIEMELSKEAICHIYSLKGERLLSQPIGPNHKMVDVSGLAANIYLLQINHSILKLVKVQ